MINIIQQIEEIFGNIIHLNSDERLFLLESFERIELKRHDFLLHENQIEKYIYFLESGILRYWLLDDNQNEITFQFAFPNEFCNAYSSQKYSKPAKYNIQSIKDCVLWRLTTARLNGLYENSLAINIFARKIMEDIFTNKIDREIFLLTHKPEERYKFLQEREKEMIKLIPQKYIASYLGITRESLSRIRKRLSYK